MSAQLSSSPNSLIQYGSLGDAVTSCIARIEVTVAISSETRGHLPSTQDSISFFHIQLDQP